MNELIGKKKKSEILAEKISKLEYGGVISHSDIANIIGEEYKTPKYSQTVTKARRILQRKYGRQIESIRGDGYRVVKPGDYVNHSLKHYKRGFKEMQKGADVLQTAPTKDMNAEELATYRRVNDRAVLLQASIKGVAVELKTLAGNNTRKLEVYTN